MNDPSFFDMVGEFNKKFGLPHVDDGPPTNLPADVVAYRVGFKLEELSEMMRALSQNDLTKVADAIGDAIYILAGTAHFFRFPLNEIFAAIHAANMTKDRVTGAHDPRSPRGHSLDIVKPSNFVPADVEIERLLIQRLARFAGPKAAE